MRLFSLFFTLAFFSVSIQKCFALAEMNCPSEVRLKDYPVHDQDGSGTCYSNTASLMMQQKFKLSRPPSYQQMAMATASYENDVTSNLTKKGEKKGVDQLFSAGGYICDTFNRALSDGWCDADQFGLDVIDGVDSLDGQNYFLVHFAELLEKKSSLMRALRNASPTQLQSLKYQLADLLMDKEKICRNSFRELIINRMTSRLYIQWNQHLSKLKGEKKQRFEKLMDKSFDRRGIPQKSFIQFLDKSFIENDIERIAQDYYQNNKLPKSSIKKESLVFSWWAYENKIEKEGISPPLQTISANQNFPYAEEAKLYGSCFTKTGAISDVFNSFLNNLNCNYQPTIMSSKDITAAEKYLDLMKKFATSPSPDEKYRDFMNLVFPRCGEQLKMRKDEIRNKVYCSQFNNDGNKKTADKIASELCKMNPVGISVCAQFLKSDSPINSKKCDDAFLKSNGLEKSFHAMSVLGYKINENGKRMFLIQNSWGRICPFNKGYGLNPNFSNIVECEKKEGIDSGRFWIDEELLLNNTMNISVLNDTK